MQEKNWRRQNKSMNSEQIDSKWKASYNTQSDKYDRVRFTGWKGEFYQNLVDRILSEILIELNTTNSIKVLDVATGTGRGALALSKFGLVIGVDLAESMLKKAQQKAKVQKLENIHFEIANARNLPFRDNSFDVIISLKFFHLMPNHVRRPIIEEMIRVLRPNGFLVLEFANPFYGVFVELYKRWFAGKTSIYIWPSQTKALFAGTKICKKRGTHLPFAQAIFKKNPHIGKFILSLSKYFPFNHLSSEIYYVCRKLEEA
jgi:ubiquinone/menaquinone biosynthesis C-methylase UbiE